MRFILLGLPFALLLLLIGFLKADPRVMAKVLRWGGRLLASVLLLALVLTGRYVYALPLAALLLWWERGWRLPGLAGGGFRGTTGGGNLGGRSAAGQRSEVRTAWLRMSLDHHSGEMAGEVLQGPMSGRPLAELDLAALLALLADCQADDPKSAALLESYLDRVHGPDWHAAFAARRAAGSGAGAGDAAGGSGRMTPAEAREVLGVSDTASPEAIREAHHRLMKKLHPDLGGSTYLASRVNAAKDVLLGA